MPSQQQQHQIEDPDDFAFDIEEPDLADESNRFLPGEANQARRPMERQGFFQRGPRSYLTMFLWFSVTVLILSGAVWFITGGRKARTIAPGIPLRILPLGDSITEGYRSTDGNGYRLGLLEALQKGGSKVEYIGSLASGNMTNNRHDGFGGYTINKIAASSMTETLKQKPNIVLLHAGTNDMNREQEDGPYNEAPARLEKLLDQVLDACPQTTLIVAQIISSESFTTAERIHDFNAAIPDMVVRRRNEGAKILSVDMSSVGKEGKDLFDGIHPTDEGYAQIAKVWMEGLMKASEERWIIPPEGIDGGDGTLDEGDGGAVNL